MSKKVIEPKTPDIEDLEVPKQEIKGYSVLTQEQKDIINDIKEMEYHLGVVFKALCDLEETDKVAMTWAKQYLQTGFMWFNRAVAKPQDFYM